MKRLLTCLALAASAIMGPLAAQTSSVAVAGWSFGDSAFQRTSTTQHPALAPAPLILNWAGGVSLIGGIGQGTSSSGYFAQTTNWPLAESPVLNGQRSSLSPATGSKVLWASFNLSPNASGDSSGLALSLRHKAANGLAAPTHARAWISWLEGASVRTRSSPVTALSTSSTAWSTLRLVFSDGNDPLPTGTALGGKSFLIEWQCFGASAISNGLSVDDWSLEAASLTGAQPLLIRNSTLAEARVGTAYQASFFATGGVLPYAWDVSEGSLPPGLFLNAATGQLSGTPSLAIDSTFTLRVVDSAGTVSRRSISLKVLESTATLSLGNTVWADLNRNGLRESSEPGIAGITLILRQGISTQELARTVTTSGGQYAFRNLVPGVYSVALIPTAAYSRTGGNPVALDNGIDNDNNGSQNLGVGTMITSPTLRLSAASEPGSSGRGNEDATIDFGLAPDPNVSLAVQPATPGPATTGRYYSAVFSTSGGAAPYAWSISTGSLPAGLTLQSTTGLLSGTITAPAGAYPFTVRVQDASGLRGTRVVTLQVAEPELLISPASLPAARVGSPYQVPFSATGGSAPFTWAVTSGTLPTGLTLDTATGVISGTPTTSGTSTFTLQATSTGGISGGRTFQVSVSAAQIVLAPISLPLAKSGRTYAAALTASGGTSPYTWRLAGGALLPGLSLNASTGVISGTLPPAPATGGSPPGAAFSIEATDASGQKAYRHQVIALESGSISVSPMQMPTFIVGQAIAPVSFQASGGTAPHSWSVVGGSLPAGLSFNTATGVLSGTPQTAGSGLFVIAATNANLAAGSRGYAFQVKPAVNVTITTATLPQALTGAPYDALFRATGGSAPYTWAVASGSLPPGLSFDASQGTITGSVTSAPAGASFPLRIRVTSADGYSGQRDYQLLIASSIAITTETLADAVAGQSYSGSRTFYASLGRSPYSWEILSGSLPSGLTLSTDTLSGIPTQPMTAAFTIRATDADGRTAQRSYTLKVKPGPLTARLLIYPALYTGVPSEQRFSASGGVQPYSWRAIPGSLPPGLAVDELTGRVVGTPLAVGAYYPRVQLTDAVGSTLTVGGSTTVSAGTSLAPSFALWKQAMPEAGGPLDDPDGDGLVNLLEYALGNSPDLCNGEASRFSLITFPMTSASSIQATAQVPSVSRNDIRLVLEVLDDLAASPAGWRTFSAAPAVLPSRELPTSTQLLVWQGFQADGAFPGPARGFARLRVILDADLDGTPEATAVSSTHGWHRQEVPAGGSAAVGMPFFNSPFLISPVIGASGSECELRLPSLGRQSLAWTLKNELNDNGIYSQELFLEVISGPAEGHRFKVDMTRTLAALSSTMETSIKISLDLASSQNTHVSPPASLIGSRIALRRFSSLASTFNLSEFRLRQPPATTPSTLHRVNALRPDGSTYDIYAVQTIAEPRLSYLAWTLATSSPARSINNRVIGHGEGFIVRASSQEPLSFTMKGQVRSHAFVQPLRAGPQLLANPWPMLLTPAQRLMTVAGGFQPGADASSADRVSTFEATASGDVLQSYYLNGPAGSESWLPAGAGGPPLAFPPGSAAYFVPLNSRLVWMQPCPWTP